MTVNYTSLYNMRIVLIIVCRAQTHKKKLEIKNKACYDTCLAVSVLVMAISEGY